jgi:hypothetical protein
MFLVAINTFNGQYEDTVVPIDAVDVAKVLEPFNFAAAAKAFGCVFAFCACAVGRGTVLPLVCVCFLLSSSHLLWLFGCRSHALRSSGF